MEEDLSSFVEVYKVLSRELTILKLDGWSGSESALAFNGNLC